MPDGENFLTQKWGPLPVWAYGGILGVGAIIFLRMRGGSSATPSGAAGAATGPPPAQPQSAAPGGSPTLGGTPVYVYSQPGQNAQTAGSGVSLTNTAPTVPLAVGSSGSSSAAAITTTGDTSGTAGANPSQIRVAPVGNDQKSAVLQQPMAATSNWTSAMLGTLNAGTTVQSAGPPIQGPTFSQNGIDSDLWQPVSWNGTIGYMWAPDTQPTTGTGGGGGPRRRTVQLAPRPGAGGGPGIVSGRGGRGAVNIVKAA